MKTRKHCRVCQSDRREEIEESIHSMDKTADDWDKETEGPMDGTNITTESGHNGELWIYGGDYDGDGVPDFLQKR